MTGSFSSPLPKLASHMFAAFLLTAAAGGLAAFAAEPLVTNSTAVINAGIIEFNIFMQLGLVWQPSRDGLRGEDNLSLAKKRRHDIHKEDLHNRHPGKDHRVTDVRSIRGS